MRAMLNWARWRVVSGADMRVLPTPIGTIDDGPFLVGRHRRRRVPPALPTRGMVAQMLNLLGALQRPPVFAIAATQRGVFIGHSAATGTGSLTPCASALREYSSMRRSISGR